ncbi:MAG: hypothetical protein QOK00_2022 [Thermoleophilaceae bacterium]|jgi:hypothetical protein|nr:hypothetical protein [Thermoleophilaceae bacterium]
MWVWSASCPAFADLAAEQRGHEWYTHVELLALGFLATKARSDVLTLSLPADLVSGLVDALDHLRTGAGADRRAELDDLARDLAGSGPLEVTARRALLGELLAVAIDEAADELSRQSTLLLRGQASAAAVRAGLAQVSGLLDLFETVDTGR